MIKRKKRDSNGNFMKDAQGNFVYEQVGQVTTVTAAEVQKGKEQAKKEAKTIYDENFFKLPVSAALRARPSTKLDEKITHLESIAVKAEATRKGGYKPIRETPELRKRLEKNDRKKGVHSEHQKTIDKYGDINISKKAPAKKATTTKTKKYSTTKKSARGLKMTKVIDGKYPAKVMKRCAKERGCKAQIYGKTQKIHGHHIYVGQRGAFYTLTRVARGSIINLNNI